jgi:glutathione peroxidase-family protein
MRSIYDIQLNSAEGTPNHLDQYKGKVTLVANTTVGCGNANQLEVLQMLQDKYNSEDFEIIAIPTNDYCGPGVTKGKWSQGITCGLDSKAYGEEVYNTTFKYSEMVSSVPHELFNEVLESLEKTFVYMEKMIQFTVGTDVEHSLYRFINKNNIINIPNLGLTMIKGMSGETGGVYHT